MGCESALIPDNMLSSDRNTADYRQVASENRKAKIEGDSRRASRQAADKLAYHIRVAQERHERFCNSLTSGSRFFFSFLFSKTGTVVMFFLAHYVLQNHVLMFKHLLCFVTFSESP